MGVIQLKTSVPGPKSRALAERGDHAVPRGLSHATPVYVARAQDAWLEDVDGNRFLDFAGGIGCINTGHRNKAVLSAIEAQLKNFLHTCAQVTPYEEYVRLAERMNRITPGNFRKKTVLLNTGPRPSKMLSKLPGPILAALESLPSKTPSTGAV